METSFYSWIRKGLGSQINEIDNLGETSDKIEIIDNEAKKRATVQLTTVVKARLLESGETSSNSESDSEKSEMDFILNGIDKSNKKDVLNAISSFAKVDLAKANEIVDSPNSFFRKTVSKTEAETFKNNLNKLGAKVVLVNVVTRTESKTIALSGPSDVISLDSKAIARVFPTPDFEAFPKDEYPYVEFWEPDFAWRFTPAKAAENGKKLRPWLALVVCESSKCSIEKTSWGTELVTFNVESDVEYKNVFPNPADVWCMAHAQSKKGEDAEFCRILGVKSNAMERNAEYRAFLIPVFEVGRLRGLRGPNYDENADQTERSLNNIAVQTSAWEFSLDEQKKKHESPLTFPSYYSWNFRTGDLSFVEKVRALVCNDAKKSGIDVDVTSLGEGLDYAVLAKKPARNKINMPAALTTVKSVAESAFPNSISDEKEVYDHLNSLLSKSPVFEENAKLVSNGSNSNVDSGDDPWITPPIYGGKHVLATSLDEKKNAKTPWLNQVNLDLHYRAAAGLGKKAVQRNQEELVNRAWKQIDAIKTLNAELNQKMLSTNVSDSVKYMNYSWAGKKDVAINTNDSANKMVVRMMKNLSLMKNTKFGKNKKEKGTSLADVMDAMKIPDAFASISFQNTTKKALKKDDDSSVLGLIADSQCYRNNGLPFANTFNVSNLSRFKDWLHPYLLKYLVVKTPLNMLFEWNENQSILNCISVKALSYVFRYQDCINRVENRSSRVQLAWNGVQNYINTLYSGNSRPAEYFANKRLWEITTYGYTEESNPNFKSNYTSFLGGNVNVYALDSSVFKEMFYTNGTPTVAKFYGLNGKKSPVYFIDRDRAKNISFYRLDVRGNLESISNVVNENFQNVGSILEIKKRQSGFSAVEQEALLCHATLFMPDYVYVKEAYLNNQCTADYTFSDMNDFYTKMAKKIGNQHSKLYDAWVELVKVTTAYVPKADPIKSIQRDSDANNKVESLKNGLRDDSAYARLKECADTYYKTFFASAELRKNYLEDCLASKYPIKAYPIFPEPAYYYLKDIADEFILPGVENLPDDSISMFKGNAAFVESYLCGMNTEMGRELLWREYPTDQRGSYFKKFWDSETTIEDIKKENYFDINSIHRWKNALGENHVVSENGSKGDLLFFAIKGDLMKLYPDTQITLRKASCTYESNKSLKFSIMNGVSEENKGILKPVSQAFVREDVYVVGFRISFKDALGSFQANGSGNSGYMLVFEKASENMEFMVPENKEYDSAAGFAVSSAIKTSIVGKHVLTLIGKN